MNKCYRDSNRNFVKGKHISCNISLAKCTHDLHKQTKFANSAVMEVSVYAWLILEDKTWN